MAKRVWFDTHCHLQDEAFDHDREEVFQRAKEVGVDYILLSTSFLEDAKYAAELALEYDHVYCSMGVHPQEASRWNDQSAAEFKKLYHDVGEKAHAIGRANPIKAIGEIGLDYYWDNDPRELQQSVYKQQIRLAHDLGLPLIIHEREAFQDSFDILAWAYDEGLLKAEAGVCHCFSGSWESAQRVLKLGFLIGLDGPVTFKNARKAKQIAREIDLDRLLLETDSPYLTPEPYRGKRNESAYIPYIGQQVAELREESLDQIASRTTANGKRIFYIDE